MKFICRGLKGQLVQLLLRWAWWLSTEKNTEKKCTKRMHRGQLMNGRGTDSARHCALQWKRKLLIRPGASFCCSCQAKPTLNIQRQSWGDLENFWNYYISSCRWFTIRREKGRHMSTSGILERTRRFLEWWATFFPLPSCSFSSEVSLACKMLWSFVDLRVFADWWLSLETAVAYGFYVFLPLPIRLLLL